jgi:uncharacterized repeat protein (TIGR01451 family)
MNRSARHALVSLFQPRSRRVRSGTAAKTSESRRRSRLLGQAEPLEHRALMAIDSVDFRSPNEFFIDASKGPLVNSEYASYKINYSSATYADVWVKLTNDIGDVVHRGLYEDGLYNVGPISGTGSAMAYLYFTADATTAVPQTHTITVYDGNPDDPNVTATVISGPRNFTFNAVYDVISANDSKILTATVSPAAPTLVPIGSTVTMTVTGQLGQADNVLFSPASRADWKADAYVLERTAITINGVLQPSDQIFFTGLPGGSSQQPTTAIYTFRLADVTGPTVTEPTQFTQKGGSRYKNDETQVLVTMPGSYNATSVVKLADGELHPQSDPLVVADTGELVTFTLRFTNTSDRTVVLDSIRDTLPAGMGIGNFIGPATYTKQGGATAILPAPVSKVTGGLTTLTWTNPFPLPGFPNFEIDAGKYADLTFQVQMPAAVGDYKNSSVGRIGKVVIDTTPTTTTDVVPATAWVACRKFADLSITKSNMPSGTVIAGNMLAYTLVVTNAGPSFVTGASVLDSFPIDLTNVTWTAAYFGGATGTTTGSGNLATAINLPNGGSAVFSVFGLVDPTTAATSISNTATVVAPSDVFDRTTTNNSSTVTNSVTRVGDLSIQKTGSSSSVVAGDAFSYTLTVNNSGTSTAVDAAIADLFPGDFTGATWTVEYFGGATGTTTGSGPVDTKITIPTGGSAVFSVFGVVNPATQADAFTNTASVTASTNFSDTNTANNSSTVTTSVTRVGDLSIQKTGSSSSVVAGDAFSYTLTVSNSGTSTAVDAAIADLFPGDFTGATWTVEYFGGATGTTTGSGPVDTKITIPTGGSAVFSVFGVVNPATQADAFTNTASVTASTNFSDTNTANNSSTVTTSVTRQADLSIEKTPATGTYAEGDTIVYTLDVTNSGPVAIPGSTLITVTDPLPSGTTFVSATGGSLVGSTVTFVFGGLAVGQTKSFTLTILVDAGRTGDLINTATVQEPTGFFDPNPDNNSSTSTFFQQEPPLSIDGGLVIGTDDGCNGRTDTVVRVIDALDGGTELLAFVPYIGWRGSVRVATGDVNGDGVDEIITAPGRTRVGEIRVFDSTTGVELEDYRLLPFGPNYRGGLEVAVGDLDGDGFGDIIAGKSTGKADVASFLTNATTVNPAPYKSFRAFAGKYKAGVKLTAGDFSSDGTSEIVVGSNAGIRATVNVWDVTGTPTIVKTIQPFASKFKGGVTLATGLYNAADLVPDIFIGAGVFGKSQLEIWSVNGASPSRLAAFNQAFANMAKPNAALFTAALDTDGNGVVDNIYGVQGQNGGRGTKGVRYYEVNPTTTADSQQLPATNNDDFRPPLRIAPLRLSLPGPGPGRRRG